MSVIAGIGKALGAEVLTGARPLKGRVLPKRMWKLAVMAVALLALVALVALIPVI